MTAVDWLKLGEDEGGLPEHIPMACNEEGQGPVRDEEALSYRCWCADPDCLLTRALKNAWRSGIAAQALHTVRDERREEGGRMTSEAIELSRLLFEAREQIAMWGDVVESRMGRRDTNTDDVRDRIDRYRAERRWSPDGYGGED